MTKFQEDSLDTNTIIGISSAIINGAGLRETDFVKECMDKGFFFESMRYKFEHRNLPLILEIDISFKQTDLKVIINKSIIIEEDEKYIKTILSKTKQSLYIDYFQNVAYELYTELINSQKPRN